MKSLIVNADDFGFTPDVNAGIVHAHRNGILTSTTLMANGDAFDDAVALAAATPTLDIGCHLVLVQGRSLVTGMELPRRPRDLLTALARKRIDPYAELRAQIERILAAGIRPSHLDTHKHTHVVPSVFRAVVRLAHEFEIPFVRLPLDHTLPASRVPLRLARRYYQKLAAGYNVRMTDHFIGYQLTGSLTTDSLAEALSHVREGTTEFMCHPGFLGPSLNAAPTRLKQSRMVELEALVSSRVRHVIQVQSIRLEAFSTVKN